MKKLMLAIFPILLTACTTPHQHSTVPLDMQAVYDYQKQITNAQSNTQAKSPNNYWELNQSDKRHTKVVVVREPHHIRPTFHHRMYYHQHGIGVHIHP